MYKISTFFIKGQLPGLTISELLDFYKKELQDQGVCKTNIDFDTINFTTSNSFTNFFYRSTNRFSNFSEGLIQIEETDTEFLVYLQGDLTNILIAPGLFAGVASLIFLLAAGFDIFPFVIGLSIFALLAFISYVSTSISFPIYFTSLRNHIEREVLSRQ